MTTVATPLPAPAGAVPPGAPVRVLDFLARWLEVFSQAAVRLAVVLAVGAATLAAGALAANVFTRYTLGYSIFGAEEFARFAFLWAVWMGVSLAVKRGAVTVLTLVRDRGPGWWRRSVRTFSGVSLAVLLVYACWRSTEFATGSFARIGGPPTLEISWIYPVASMPVGYYLITLHFAAGLAATAARAARRGPVALRDIATGALGGFAIGFAVWGTAWLLLEADVSKLVPLGLIFATLTLAGTPIVFMLSIVGIIALLPSFLGLVFYPQPDPVFPFSITQFGIGLSGGAELMVILMFLVVAEVMNASGMADRLIAFAGACVGHLRGGMAYVCQLTSAMASGISGSAQADAAIMTPLLVPAMEKEGYRRDVAAAVVAGASIKGPIGPISIMFIAYGTIVSGPGSASINKLLLSGVMAETLLLLFQALTVYIVVRRLGFLKPRAFAGVRTVARTGASALPVLAIPVIILGGILGGVFTPVESAAVAAIVTVCLALFWYSSMPPRQLPRVIAGAALETGIVVLLVGDSLILAKALFNDQFGQSLESFLTGLTDNKYVFLLVVNLLLLAVGIFIEPLPALYILAPFLAPIAVLQYDIDPVHFGLIMVFNLVLALIHPPIGLVLFVVSSIARVSVERLSIMILPWLAVSLVVLFLITYLPTGVVLALSDLIE